MLCHCAASNSVCMSSMIPIPKGSGSIRGNELGRYCPRQLVIKVI